MRAFSITDVGMARSINQDCVFQTENAIGNLPNLFVVADGMGGHKAGDMASRLCVEALTGEIRALSLKTPVSILNEAITKANAVVYEEAAKNPDYHGMGTTLVAATVCDGCLYVANIGDSRLYIISDGMEQITEDHSYVEEMVRNGKLLESEARNHPRKNVITRALGTSPKVTADVFEVELRAGDILLLCSDGLTNMLSDREIFELVNREKISLEETGKKLIGAANAQGGRDNISVVLAEY